VSDTFNTFQYWREPVQCLVLPEGSSHDATKSDADEQKAAVAGDRPNKSNEAEFEDEEVC
jgi:hypothetical protein